MYITETKARCRKCGHEWKVRALHPRACPACKRYDWDENISTKRKGKK